MSCSRNVDDDIDIEAFDEAFVEGALWVWGARRRPSSSKGLMVGVLRC